MAKYFSSSCMGILKWEVFLESHGFSYLEVERSVCVVFLMVRVSEDHVMIQYKLWIGLVLSCNHVVQFPRKFLFHELADMENWWNC